MNNKNTIIGIVGLVSAVAALVWYTITNIWGIGNWILIVLGTAGTVYYMVAYYKTRERTISTRSMKYGSNVLLQVVIIMAIVAMAAFVSTRQHIRTDLTANNFWSLSDQTVKILEGLDKPVEVKAFFKTADQNAVKDNLDEFQYISSHFSYELIDPDEEPQITQQYGIKQYSLVVESGVKKEQVTEMSEANIINAIIKVTREQDKAIYVLTGHGERSIKDDTPQGYKTAAEAIKKENHLVRELNLARRGSIPDSCTVLAVFAPQTDLFPAELDTIEQYIKNGGKLFAAVDPEKESNFKSFLEKFHVTIGADMVIDQSFTSQLFGSGPGVPLINAYDNNHAITKDFRIMTFFPYTSSVTPMDDKGGYEITELIRTSESSWADPDFKSGEVSYDPASDKKGPITIAAIVQKNLVKGKSALAIYGDSDFANNGYFGQQGNGNLFLNTINFLAEEEDLISIRPKEIDDRRLTLTQANVKTLFYLVVIAIPLLVIILGVMIFFKRNRA